MNGSKGKNETSPWLQPLDIHYDFTPDDIEEMTRIAEEMRRERKSKEE
mgnify:CR=1 FL=1